jgi:hypothetical protein
MPRKKISERDIKICVPSLKIPSINAPNQIVERAYATGWNNCVNEIFNRIEELCQEKK